MKGIILAGGSGTRLSPLTSIMSKQLLPIYDKPMIYYPLSVLMLAGLREILIITTPSDSDQFKRLLGDGSKIGVNLSYKEQKKPSGIAEAFIIGEDFIGNDNVCLILGDNIFYGHNFSSTLQEATKLSLGAKIFSYPVNDPERFGIAEIDENGFVKSLEEKPQFPKANNAVTGLYFYDNSCIERAKTLNPSNRGELEITDLNLSYLNENLLECVDLGRGFAWLDTGTHESLLKASQFVEILEQRQGFKVACIEEIAFTNNWIEKEALASDISKNINSSYYQYLNKILNEK